MRALCVGGRDLDIDRRQNREDVGHELVFEPVVLGRRQVARLDDADALALEFGTQADPARLLVGDQGGGEAVDGGCDLPKNAAFRAAINGRVTREADVYAVQGQDAAQLLAGGPDATKGDVAAPADPGTGCKLL